MKEEKFPHTRKPLHWWRWGVGGQKLQSHGGECSNRGTEGKAGRFPHSGLILTSTHQPERLVCSPARVEGSWEVRLGLQSSDPRERTGWLHEHSLKGASMPQLARRESGKSLELSKSQKTIVLGCARRGDSEHRLNGLQR